WDIASPDVVKGNANYIQPGREYKARDLGFTGHKVFYIEGINPAERTAIEVVMKYSGVPLFTGTDRVRVTVVEPDLGVNHGNGGPVNQLRTGIPDMNFVIDENDEKIESQKEGFLFWWSRDPVPTVSEEGIVDLAPMVLDMPKSLLD